MFPIRDSIPNRHTPLAVWALIAGNVIIFVLELSLPPQSQQQFFYMFGMVPARLTQPDWAADVGFPSAGYVTLLTSMFLHGGWLHIIFNLWMLWIFGDNIEDLMGPIRFMVFYLTCGLVAALVHLLTNIASIVPTVGASGAIAGVMGAYFRMYPRARVLTVIPIFFWPFFIEIPAIVFLGFWFLSQLLSGGAALAAGEQIGGIAWWAHIGGFVAGILLCRIFFRPEEKALPVLQDVREEHGYHDRPSPFPLSRD